MSLLNIPLDKIGEADFQRLKSMGAAESPYLDYKQETYGDSDGERSEFLPRHMPELAQPTRSFSETERLRVSASCEATTA